jgi:ubiquinone/menaquinone biosynthesis C-methylase UbiE
MTDATSSIQEHYGSGDLVERLLEALAGEGYDSSAPTVEMLNLVDQLHGGGLNSTMAQADLAGVTGSMRILDVGCGIGGSSRYLAHTFGSRVEAIDLTSEFVDVSTRLNALCGMDEVVSVRQGSATDLPYDDESFDLVWCQNVTMNVEDKLQMFSEAHRVLTPGGRYTISHAAQGPAGEPYFPLPWAREPSYSFLGTPEEVLGWLSEAGFDILENRSEGGGAGGNAPRPTARISTMAQEIILGEDFSERQANSKRSSEEGRLAPMLIVAARPA